MLAALQALSLLLPFAAEIIAIIREAQRNGEEFIPLARLQGAWQAQLDKNDEFGRRRLQELGGELPPPKPEPR